MFLKCQQPRPLIACSLLCVGLAMLHCTPSLAQSTTSKAPAAARPEALSITKIDPPNWFAALPKPMLLIHGTGLGCARFSLSDSSHTGTPHTGNSITVERTTTSANGHWAQLYLAASPLNAETVTLRAACANGEHIEQPYTFAARRSAQSGMAGFNARDVIYLVMTDRFADGDLHNDGATAHDSAGSQAAADQRADPRGWHGGDLRGVEQHLDYLQQLGITTVWVTPVYQNHSPVAYHGYHATDYYSVDEHYGSLQALQSLAAALHSRGMKLVLDTVPNHTGPLHPWVNDEPAPEWFHGTAAQHLDGESNFEALVNPHAPESDRVGTLDGWFVNELPDNNTDAPAVALYQRQNAVWWIEETGADGLRIDTFPYVDRPFWNAFNGELKTLYPNLTEVGEVSGDDPVINSAFAGGVMRAGGDLSSAGVDTKLYTPFDYPMYHAAVDVFARGAPFGRISRILGQDGLYPHPERLVPFLGNHDQPRLATLVADPAARRLAWAFLLTTRGTPEMYAGDEIAMTGGDDPANRQDFPGGFPHATQNAFTAAGRTATQNAEFDWVQHLLKLRSTFAPLACGAEQVLSAEKDTFVYVRYNNAAHAAASTCTANSAATSATTSTAEAILVFLTRSQPVPRTVHLPGTALAGCRHPSVIDGRAHVSVSSQQLSLEPQSSFVLVACRIE
jgi:glycosidase